MRDQGLDEAIRVAGGWGNQNHLRVDFSMDVLAADSTATPRMFSPTEWFEVPDCDHVPVPVPENGNLEGETDYRCRSGGDCHLIVFDAEAGQLYEMWRANIAATFEGGCLAVWDTRKGYDETLRGDQCTSADAAGVTRKSALPNPTPPVRMSTRPSSRRPRRFTAPAPLWRHQCRSPAPPLPMMPPSASEPTNE